LPKAAAGKHEGTGGSVKILREGDVGTALASGGRGWVPIVYEYRTVRLEKTGVDVPNVLVGVDRETDEVLVIPSQSTPRLKSAREAVKEEVFQVKIPHELDDVLVVLSDRFGATPSKFTPALLRFYLTEACENTKLAARLVKLSGNPLATGRTGAKLSFRASAEFAACVRQAAKTTKGASKSALARGAIVAAKEDLLDGRSRSRKEKLQAVAQAL
jgi:hypothetical protein